jgi:hypothetical protein
VWANEHQRLAPLIDFQVSYRNGVNEKVLGDFIRKHNVRDKIFCEPDLQ